MSRSLLLSTLIAKEACKGQVNLFKKHFGKEVQVTEVLCIEVGQVFKWDWASHNLLSAPAWEAYNKARASAWEAYNKAIAPVWEAYDEARAPARKAYEEARASTFAKLYIKEGE